MSNKSSPPIKVVFKLDDIQRTLEVLESDDLSSLISKITKGKIVSICCYCDEENNSILFQPRKKLVAKRSVKDNNMISIFYNDEEIISTKGSDLTINLKIINMDVNKVQIQKLDSSFINLALLIQNETHSPTTFEYSYAESTDWKMELRQKLQHDSELVFIDPITKKEKKVFLGPEEVKFCVHDSNYCDKREYSHLLFVHNTEDSEFELSINNENFNVIPIWSISKFILKNGDRSSSINELELACSVQQDTVIKSFMAGFNELKLNSVAFIRAHASVYSYLYQNYTKFYCPMACLCQCSGAGKSKSATTVLKETPGFYVCLRDPQLTSFAVPKATATTDAILKIFKENYIADGFEEQNNIPYRDSTVGKCLTFIARSIKSYMVTIAENLASKLSNSGESDYTLNAKLLSEIKEFSSINFEASDTKFKSFFNDSMNEDFLKAAGADPNLAADTDSNIPKVTATVLDVTKYIKFVLEDPRNCFKFDVRILDEYKQKIIQKIIINPDKFRSLHVNFKNELFKIEKNQKKDFIQLILNEPDDRFNLKHVIEQELSKLDIACEAISGKITKDNPFIFFIDEAGLLSKGHDYLIKAFKDIPAGKFTAFQIFRRALSYLDLETRIFFFAIGTKSTIEELSPPVIDNSTRGKFRREFFPPVIITQNFDIWREKYPLNEIIPCYKTLLNCCTFKLLATLGHPMFSSLNFDDIVKLTLDKLYNGSKETDKIYLLAIWMIRGGLACDPKSVLAETLIENHMATVFKVKLSEDSSKERNSNQLPISFGKSGSSCYDITYQSTPCLALAARDASLSLPTSQKYEFFEKLESKIESMVVDRGKLGEATGGLLTALIIDEISNEANIKMTDELIQEMKNLTPTKFHQLWETDGSLLCPYSKKVSEFSSYKVIKVESFLKRLMGDDDFERIKPTLPSSTLNGLINATHFVSISRIGGNSETKIQPLSNANDFVSDENRNVITMDRLRLALLRQSGIILPPNYYGIDAIISVCLSKEEVIDPNDNVTIQDVNRIGRENEVPYYIFDSERDKGKNRYRPIYSFIGIQYKSGNFELKAIPKMQAKLHIVPCINYSKRDSNGNHIKCSKCVSDLALQEVFNSQISLLYCFLSKEVSNSALRKQISVNYGRKFQSADRLPSPSSFPESEEEKKLFIFKTLYPNMNEACIKSLKGFASDLDVENMVRTFESFHFRHRIKINDNFELINICYDENQGCTYRESDLRKWESSKKKRNLQETVSKKAKVDVDESIVDKFENLQVNNASSYGNPVADSNMEPVVDFDIEPVPDPDPICLPTPYDKGRMSTIVVYGWKPWDNVIGEKGVQMASKLFLEFVQDPLRNIANEDLKVLIPSLKIIMSSKMLGLDRYLEEEHDEDEITQEQWLVHLFEKNKTIFTPNYSKLYENACKFLKEKNKKLEEGNKNKSSKDIG